METISKIHNFLNESRFIQKLLKSIEFETQDLTNTIDSLLFENFKIYDIYFNILLINRIEKTLAKYTCNSHNQLNNKVIMRFIKSFIWPEALESDCKLLNKKTNQLIFGKI
tara:strand:+ start:21479 stop:21811 length:333 start_codon:yes stop_codon:yes gene_type:complete